MIGMENTLTLNPLRESHSGEYSCLVTDGPIVGCEVHRVTVQGIDCLVHLNANLYLYVSSYMTRLNLVQMEL